MSLHPPAPAPAAAQHQRHNNCKVWYLVWLHCGKLSRFMTDAPHCCTLGRVQHHTMANKLLYNPNLVQKETRFAIPRHFSTMWQCVVYFTLILTLFPSSSCFICHNVSKCEVYSWNARSVVVRCFVHWRFWLLLASMRTFLEFCCCKIWPFVRDLAFFFCQFKSKPAVHLL